VAGIVAAAAEDLPMSFAGKAVLVTGSTTGIGEACAKAFAASGVAVMVSGRHEQRGRAVAQAIAGPYP
jgi:NAD(P)-dependent dehydrogenase (short-subunit alcohol dehydrogenase family)